MASIEIGQTFSSLATAKAAIKLAISEQHESFIIDYSDKTRFRIMCLMRTQSNCEFQVRATDSKKHGVTITHAKPHTCSPATHFQARNTHAVQFLLPHHRASVVDNPKISIKQIQSNERLQFHNTISYQQAYRVKEAVLQELWGDESECFAQFPDYIDRFKSADPQTEHTLILVVITGLMQHSLLQLGFGMQDDIYVDSQLLMVHIQSQDIGCYY